MNRPALPWPRSTLIRWYWPCRVIKMSSISSLSSRSEIVRSLARTTLELPAAATLRSKPGVPPTARAIPLSTSTIAAPVAPSIASRSAMTLSSCATVGSPVVLGGGRSRVLRTGSGGDPVRHVGPDVRADAELRCSGRATLVCVAPAGGFGAVWPPAGGGSGVGCSADREPSSGTRSGMRSASGEGSGEESCGCERPRDHSDAHHPVAIAFDPPSPRGSGTPDNTSRASPANRRTFLLVSGRTLTARGPRDQAGGRSAALRYLPPGARAPARARGGEAVKTRDLTYVALFAAITAAPG